MQASWGSTRPESRRLDRLERLEDARISLEETIRRRNDVVTGIGNLDEVLMRRVAETGDPPPGDEAHNVVGFANLTLAHDAIRVNPGGAVPMLGPAVIVRIKEACETTSAPCRPLFYATGPALAIARVMHQADADIRAIPTDVTAD